MRSLAAAVICGWLASGCESDDLPPAQADHLAWMTDLPKAQAQAKAENKMVMIFFTGSDWCPSCRYFHNGVLAKPEFANFAAKSLVLVEADFPHKKPQSEALVKANTALQEKYQVTGYPTVVVLGGSGEKLWFYENDGSGAADFVARLEKLKKS